MGVDHGEERAGKLRGTRFRLCATNIRFLTRVCLLQLFGASAVTKDYLFGVTDFSKATWGQNFVASIAGAVASITIAAPLDTIKTRIQNANFEHKVSGFTVVKDLLRDEGPSALFKGLTPKVCYVGYPTSDIY